MLRIVARLVISATIFLTLAYALSPTPRVAIVTGATRGVGKGIAQELGAAGYKVHCLGRSSRSGGAIQRDMGAYRRLPEEELTVESAAEAVTKLGGTGIPHSLDVSNDKDLNSLVSSIVDLEGRLDVLVCSAYSVPTLKLRDDFWKQGMEMWDEVNGVGLRSVYASCVAAAPHLIKTAMESQKPPLICLVSSFGGKSYTFNVAYGVGKAAVDRFAKDMSVQLSRHGVATTALYPGLVKTECNLEMEKMGTWEEASGGLDLR